MDLVEELKAIFTYVKLGPIIIFGFIKQEHRQEWTGTRINANGGVIAMRDTTVPAELFYYWNEKTRTILEAPNTISERQQAKIDDALKSNLNRVIASEYFSAIGDDIGLWGRGKSSK